MKGFKYIISLLLFCMIAVCVGEFYQVHISSEASFTNFFILAPISAEDRQSCYRDLLQTADENNVCICFSDMENDANFAKTDITIYASDMRISEYMNEVYGIREGTSKSIFLSQGRVQFKNLRQEENFQTLSAFIGRTMNFGIIGTPEDTQSFLRAVENRYRLERSAAGNPDWNFYTSLTFYVQLVLWLIAYAILFTVSLYDVKLMQKEWAVRCSLGERKGVLFLKKSVFDSLFFIVSFFAVFLIASRFTESLFFFPLSVLFFIGFLLINTLSVALIFTVDIKKAFGGNVASKSVLSASYMLKILTSILLVIILGVGIGQFSKLLTLKQQDKVLQNYKDYFFIDGMSYEDTIDMRDTRTAMLYKLQKEYFSQSALQSTYIGDCQLHDGKVHQGVVCSKNAEAYLREIIPELQEKPLGEKMYVLTPQYAGCENDYPNLREWAQPNLNGDKGYVFCHDYDVEFIPYTQDVSMVVFDSNEASRTLTLKNPVIFFSGLEESNLHIADIIGTAERKAEGIGVSAHWTGGLAPTPYAGNLMLRISSEDLSAFAAENHFNYTLLNVYENYQQSVKRAEKICLMTGLLAIVFFVMEAILIQTVVRLEYSIRAKELAVKKILGYSILEKNKKILLTTLLVIAVGFLGAVAACIALHITVAIVFLLLGGLLLSLLEVCVVVHNIVRTEKTEVVKILKGDSL